MTTEERVSRLEGSYEHMASKSDLAELKAEFAGLRADLLLGFREMQLQLAELRNQFAELRNLIISQRGGRFQAVSRGSIGISGWQEKIN